MRNFWAALVGGAVGFGGIGLIIVPWSLLVLLGPMGTSKTALIVQMYVFHASLLFIACIPAGIVAALVAAPDWRHKAAVIGAMAAWTICFLLSCEVWFSRPDFPVSIWYWAMKITIQIAGLLGAIAGGLVGAIIYQKIQTKWRRQQGRAHLDAESSAAPYADGKAKHLTL